MGKRVCAGALVLSITASIALLPLAVVKVAKEIRALTTLDSRVAALYGR